MIKKLYARRNKGHPAITVDALFILESEEI